MIETKLLKPYKHITWECTTVCNYSCSYCWPDCHNGLYRWPSLEQTESLISYLKTFSNNDPVLIDIMGGEPTLWPHLNKFCNDISDFAIISFSTNGSRTFRFWQEFNAPIDHLIFSFHPEFASIDHYIEILKLLQHRYHVSVLILYHPLYKEKCELLFDTIDKTGIEVNVSYKFIQFSEEIELPREMLLNINKSIYRSPVAKSNIQDSPWTINDREIDPEKLIKSRGNKFLNWTCYLGEIYRYIKANGDIYGAACGIAPKIGNVYDGVFNDPYPIVCSAKYCDCKTDVTHNRKCYTQE